MAGLKGMGKPQNLVKPVPGADDQMQTQVQAQQGMPQFGQTLDQFAPAAPANYVERPPIESLYAEETDKPSIESLYAEPTDTPTEDEPGFFGANFTPSGVGEQLSDLPTRMKASFAMTSNEKRHVLEQKYGQENVRFEGDKFKVRKDGKWKQFDKDTFELIGDLADFTREAVEAPISAAATGLGLAAAGAETATGLGVVAAPVTVGAARAAGNIAAHEFGNMLAQDTLGIPRDPERSRTLENTAIGGAGALFGAGGDWFANKLAARQATRTAVVAGEAEAKTIAKDVLEGAERLKEAGIIENIPGTDTPLMPHQVSPTNIEALQAAAALDKNPKFRSVLQAQGRMIAEGFERLWQKAGLKAETQAGVGEKLQESVNHYTTAEGKIIGEARKLAAEMADGGNVPLQTTGQVVKDMGEEFGFKRIKDRLVVPSANDIMDKYGLNETEANSILYELKHMQEMLVNNEGLVPFETLHGIYTRLSKKIDVVSKSDSKRGAMKWLVQIKNGVRDDMTEGIGTLTDGPAKEIYEGALKNFSAVKGASETITKVLEQENLSAQGLSAFLFNKGRDGLNVVRAAKGVLNQTNPQVWNDVRSNFLGQVVENARDKATNMINWNAVSSKLEGLGDEMLTELFGSKQVYQHFKDMSRIAANFEKTNTLNMSPKAQDNIFKELIITAQSGGWIGRSIDAVVRSLSFFNRDQKLAKFVSQKGVEHYVQLLPKAQQSQMREALTRLVSMDNVLATGAKVNRSTRTSVVVGTGATQQTAGASDPIAD